AAGDAASRSVFGPAAGFDVAFLVNGLDGLAIVDPFDLTGEPAGLTVAQSDRVECQRHLGFTSSLARLLERANVTFDDRFGVIARIEHDGREFVAFPVRLRADLVVEADLHRYAVRNDRAVGDPVVLSRPIVAIAAVASIASIGAIASIRVAIAIGVA